MDSSWIAIWKDFQDGNQVAFAHIYNRYVDTLYRYGLKVHPDPSLIRDSIQEVFIDLYSRRAKFSPDAEHLKYYLMLSFKRNLLRRIEYQRKNITHKKLDKFILGTGNTPETIIEERESSIESHKRLNILLEGLSAREKEALFLKFNESMDYPEIAQIMNISIESVRKQVYRAIKKLKKATDIQGIVLFLAFFKKKHKKLVHE